MYELKQKEYIHTWIEYNPFFLFVVPIVWLLGNLARATYVGSSNWMWPFSYDVCDPKRIHEQDINACRKIEHYGMKKGVGRGAPEIDILEVMGGEKGKLPNTPIQRPYFSSSFQVCENLLVFLTNDVQKLQMTNLSFY